MWWRTRKTAAACMRVFSIPRNSSRTTLGRNALPAWIATNSPSCRSWPMPDERVDGDLVWKKIGPFANIPVRGARRLCFGMGGKPIAVFRTGDDKVFALVDECPHKKGPLSEGIISGNSVTCPLHNWVIGLDTGIAQEPDVGSTQTIPVKLVNGELYVGLLLERAV